MKYKNDLLARSEWDLSYYSNLSTEKNGSFRAFTGSIHITRFAKRTHIKLNPYITSVRDALGTFIRSAVAYFSRNKLLAIIYTANFHKIYSVFLSFFLLNAPSLWHLLYSPNYTLLRFVHFHMPSSSLGWHYRFIGLPNSLFLSLYFILYVFIQYIYIR